MKERGRRSFRWLFAEMLVVVCGILIAVQIEEYRAGLEAERQERASLVAILRDLELGERELELYVEAARRSRDHYLALLELVHGEGSPGATQIEALSDLPSDRLWRPTATAFTGIRETGRIDLISDTELQRELVEYFDTFEPFFLDLRLTLSEERDRFKRILERDFDLIPTETYPTDGSVRRELRVPAAQWPTADEFGSSLIAVDQRTIRTLRWAESGISMLGELRASIEEYLPTLE